MFTLKILYLDVNTLKTENYQHTVLCELLGSVGAQVPAFTCVLQQLLGLMPDVSSTPKNWIWDLSKTN